MRHYRPPSEYIIGQYHQLPENLMLFWGSIYFMQNKVVDFPTSGHKYMTKFGNMFQIAHQANQTNTTSE